MEIVDYVVIGAGSIGSAFVGRLSEETSVSMAQIEARTRAA
jgi:hypothetical protein